MLHLRNLHRWRVYCRYHRTVGLPKKLYAHTGVRYAPCNGAATRMDAGGVGSRAPKHWAVLRAAAAPGWCSLPT